MTLLHTTYDICDDHGESFTTLTIYYDARREDDVISVEITSIEDDNGRQWPLEALDIGAIRQYLLDNTTTDEIDGI